MWWYAVVWIVSFALTYAMMPKPGSTARPAGINDINAPTAEEGREIPVLFGTRVVKGPNVVWYGDLRTEAIKK